MFCYLCIWIYEKTESLCKFIHKLLVKALIHLEKLLIEYATKEFIHLIIVCASGGARMQEGSLSLMQMAKIAVALNYMIINEIKSYSMYQSLHLLLPCLHCLCGVTASFGMLGDIIIAEPHAYIAFAGKNVLKNLCNLCKSIAYIYLFKTM